MCVACAGAKTVFANFAASSTLLALCLFAKRATESVAREGSLLPRAGLLDEYGAAGDVDDDAADPCGVVGGEEQGRLRDVFGGA